MKMSKKTILVAEDKDYLADIIFEYLGNEFECLRASSVDEVYQKINDVDAALVSLNVRKADSIKPDVFVRKIKEIKDVPMLILTSMLSSSIRILLLEAGADDVMTKPFNPDEMKLRMLKLVK